MSEPTTSVLGSDVPQAAAPAPTTPYPQTYVTVTATPTFKDEFKALFKMRLAWFLAGALCTHGDPSLVFQSLLNFVGV